MCHQASAHLVQEQIRGQGAHSQRTSSQRHRGPGLGPFIHERRQTAPWKEGWKLQTTEPAVWPDAGSQAGEPIAKLRSTAKSSDEDFQRERDKETRASSVVLRAQRTHQGRSGGRSGSRLTRHWVGTELVPKGWTGFPKRKNGKSGMLKVRRCHIEELSNLQNIHKAESSRVDHPGTALPWRMAWQGARECGEARVPVAGAVIGLVDEWASSALAAWHLAQALCEEESKRRRLCLHFNFHRTGSSVPDAHHITGQG
ncbi:hypothetical protein NDU88_002438 [Pleurodeles waltl]|uniref:Uncharacterized protein n=1 Tax=Pleurodeles waltl TaxID=8319 RepID=A0AAV7UD72_PLEWA|nr:hypothetical protein NDU88_002438 [Pleurodeles waltl]